MDRRHSGFRHDVVHLREMPLLSGAEELRLRILMDKYSLELFTGDGEAAASMTLYTPLTADGLSFSAEGSALLDVEKYDICVE